MTKVKAKEKKTKRSKKGGKKYRFCSERNCVSLSLSLSLSRCFTILGV
jgi:hypothetical protein